MAYQTILLFGPPGAGKGTWGGLLGRIPTFCHVSSGEMFRALAPESELGRVALSCIRKGELVPDRHAVALWREYMQKLATFQNFSPTEDHLILDGLPRTRQQAEMVRDDLDVRLILALDCPDRDVLVDRLYRRALIEHRSDDASAEIIHRRFEVYDQQTEETLSYYSKSLVRTIDVSQTPHRILLDLSQALVDAFEEPPGRSPRRGDQK